MKKIGSIRPSVGGKRERIGVKVGRVVIIMQIVSVVFAMALCVTMSRSLTMGLLEKRCTAGTNMLSYAISKTSSTTDMNQILEEIRDTNGGFPIEVDLDGYTFEIDENGKVTRKAVKPVVNYTLSTEEQVDEGTEVTVTITAIIGEEETITKITKPDGTSVTNTAKTTFVVKTNGIYTVVVEGSNGETTTCKVKVFNIGTTEIFSDIYTTTAEYTDKNGNTAKIPEGFAVGESNTINTVDGGLVITDRIDENHKSTGNQFVWIPVGKVKSADGSVKNIELNRYGFDGTGSYGENAISTSMGYCRELTTSSYGNTTAIDIKSFIESANSHFGYYLGRYEAGKETNSDGKVCVVSKPNCAVYGSVQQPTAATLAQEMFLQSEKPIDITSDLVNSYAWDTALVYIQAFSGDTNYAKQRRLQSRLTKTGQATDGTNKDVRCNIYDMCGNAAEWTTETGEKSGYGGVSRGDWCGSGNTRYTAYRAIANGLGANTGFRTILYL